MRAMAMSLKHWLRDTRRCFVPLQFKDVHRLYDREYAERTDHFAQSESWIQELDGIIGQLALAPSSRVLDFGCNTGRLVTRLQNRVGCEVYGIDQNCEAVEIARSAHPDAQFNVCDDTRLPYEDGYFDAIMMSHVIGHLPEPLDMLVELRRILRPGGRLAVLTPNRWFKICMILPNLLNGYRPDPTVLRYYSRRTLARTLEAASLRMIEQCFLGEPPAKSGPANLSVFRARLMAIVEK
jgi:ubiquinone/menaquinone biosynthesis C-methylase UbiE